MLSTLQRPLFRQSAKNHHHHPPASTGTGTWSTVRVRYRTIVVDYRTSTILPVRTCIFVFMLFLVRHCWRIDDGQTRLIFQDFFEPTDQDRTSVGPTDIIMYCSYRTSTCADHKHALRTNCLYVCMWQQLTHLFKSRAIIVGTCRRTRIRPNE
jgi:hypothetical protein